jgi:quinol monooxygenase YgiN
MSSKWIFGAINVALVIALAACGDDTSSGGGGAAAAGGDDQGGGGSGEAGAGGAQGGAPGAGGQGGGGGAPAIEALAFVRGPLFTTDLDEAQAYHDDVAEQGEAPAQAAGDFAHEVFLGTSLLGTTPNEFVAIDRWTSDENMDAFYSDPAFERAFGGVFARPPMFDTFLASDFYGWGDIDAGDESDPRFIVAVRGRLADDPEVIRPQHDAVAQGGEAQANAAGDVAHVVHLGRADQREILIIDVWTSDENVEAFYGDPEFQEALGPLFEAPPTIGVYRSTDWYQW